MFNRIFTICLISSIFIFNGCAGKAGNERLGEMNKEQMDSKIVKGKTTKAQVKAILGDPKSAIFMTNGDEKWIYVHARVAQKAINYVPIANWFVKGTNNTTKTIQLIFDDEGVVKKYISNFDKSETKGGLFQ